MSWLSLFMTFDSLWSPKSLFFLCYFCEKSMILGRLKTRLKSSQLKRQKSLFYLSQTLLLHLWRTPKNSARVSSKLEKNMKFSYQNTSFWWARGHVKSTTLEALKSSEILKPNTTFPLFSHIGKSMIFYVLKNIFGKKIKKTQQSFRTAFLESFLEAHIGPWCWIPNKN